MNKQPFYHRVTVLFTCTAPLTEKEFLALLRVQLRSSGVYVPKSLEAEEFSAEAGDPADLI